MKKYISAGFVALALFFSVGFATPVQAAQLTEAQASAILGLLSSFGADAATIQNVKVAIWPGAATDPTNDPGHEALTCVALTHQLTVGSTDASTGGEVSQLQVFLEGQGTVNDPVYPERVVNGNFGPATSRAVQKWQTAHGIAITTTGVGVVGPKTRAAMTCR